MSQGTKVCKKCGTEKPRSEFYRAARNKDGLLGSCKTCIGEQQKAYRAQNPDKIREESRRRRERDPEGHREHQRAYRRRHPHKSRERQARMQREEPTEVNARRAVGRALKRGDIVRPDACTRCGRDDTGIQAHHEDYSKPLDVEWLCTYCHAEADRKRRESLATGGNQHGD